MPRGRGAVSTTRKINNAYGMECRRSGVDMVTKDTCNDVWKKYRDERKKHMELTIEVRQTWTLRGRMDTITSDTWHGL